MQTQPPDPARPVCRSKILNLKFESNLYCPALNQGLFNWGTTWKKHQKYESLEAVQRELSLDQNSRVTEFHVEDFCGTRSACPRGQSRHHNGLLSSGSYPGHPPGHAFKPSQVVDPACAQSRWRPLRSLPLKTAILHFADGSVTAACPSLSVISRGGSPFRDRVHVGTLASGFVVDPDHERAIIERRHPTPLVSAGVIDLDSGPRRAPRKAFAPNLQVRHGRCNHDSVYTVLIHNDQLAYAQNLSRLVSGGRR